MAQGMIRPNDDLLPIVPARADNDDSRESALGLLKERASQHPLWDCPLLRELGAGHLTREDCAFVFSQYYLYSRNFTRFLAGAMAGLDDDAFRARLCQNLWEESGMLDLTQRHSELFRRFLRDGLGVDPDAIEYEDCARYFVARYLDRCTHASAAEASAFLAIGTEGLVPRLYSTFVRGLRAAGVDEGALRFFLVHIECDDEHAATLEQIMLSYSGEPTWLDTAWRAVDHAMTLRRLFFDQLFERMRVRRLRSIMARVQQRRSLCAETPDGAQLVAGAGLARELYRRRVPQFGIDFTVDSIAFAAEVLDPRTVRIKPSSNNEHHKHAHEAVFVFLEGRGEVRVNGTAMPVKAGEIVFVPRWAMHQTFNTGESDLVFVAVTDCGLTGKLFVGNYLRTARQA
jgi:mannose-6-phosphate isomerase-like protein (cupin superfamily)/pyrroloquinoline quinone (PQQ) biosynthesis protein C